MAQSARAASVTTTRDWFVSRVTGPVNVRALPQEVQRALAEAGRHGDQLTADQLFDAADHFDTNRRRDSLISSRGGERTLAGRMLRAALEQAGTAAPQARPVREPPIVGAGRPPEKGIASFYHEGRVTATGELWNDLRTRNGVRRGGVDRVENLAAYPAARHFSDEQLQRAGMTRETRIYPVAHQTLPFGTIVRIGRTDDGRHIYGRVADRGPFEDGRIIDVSRAGAGPLGLRGAGLGPVEVVDTGLNVGVRPRPDWLAPHRMWH